MEREKQNEDVEPRESLRRDPEYAGGINPRRMITHGEAQQQGASIRGPLGTGFRNDPRLDSHTRTRTNGDETNIVARVVSRRAR